MRITDFSIAPKEDFDDLKAAVDSASPGVYTFDDCELPEVCTPNTATISIGKDSDSYNIYCHEDIRYRGHNPSLYKLFKYNQITSKDWASFVRLCRKFKEDSPEPEGSGESNEESEGADWSNITIPSEQAIEQTLSFDSLRKEMKKSIIGQDDAVDMVCFQTAAFTKKKRPKKPLSLLAYGPPGIGKSETAKCLASILSKQSGHTYATVWTDLNTFTEAHTVYRLIGSPPGYVGYEDKPVFEAVLDNPYTVFIFDELDKAHPQVLKTFMAILDEGRCASRSRLPDGSREFDFKHCIFFFTSNYVLSGDNQDTPKNPIGFSISNDVEDISFDDGAVKVAYTKEEVPVDIEESITQRIYKQTEQARREFIKCGTLAEIASRFHGFVEYKPLSNEAKAKILAKQIIETGFEYGVRIGYISKGVMQGIIDEVSSENSLTVRSFKAVIEGRLIDAFASINASDDDIYKIEGSIEEPILVKM